MFLINIHKLQIILAQPVTLAALEDQVENIGRILSLQCKDILSLGCTENLCKGGKIDTESYIAIAAVGGEAFGLEHHGNQCNMGVVHGLEGDTGIIAIEVAVLDEILDGVNDLETD